MVGVVRDALDISRDRTKRWTAAWRYMGDGVACAARDLDATPMEAGNPPTGRDPGRGGAP